MRINSINTSFAIVKPKKNRDIKTTSPQKDTFVSSTSFGISNYEKVFFKYVNCNYDFLSTKDVNKAFFELLDSLKNAKGTIKAPMYERFYESLKKENIESIGFRPGEFTQESWIETVEDYYGPALKIYKSINKEDWLDFNSFVDFINETPMNIQAALVKLKNCTSHCSKIIDKKLKNIALFGQENACTEYPLVSREIEGLGKDALLLSCRTNPSSENLFVKNEPRITFHAPEGYKHNKNTVKSEYYIEFSLMSNRNYLTVIEGLKTYTGYLDSLKYSTFYENGNIRSVRLSEKPTTYYRGNSPRYLNFLKTFGLD